jgi:hypothetical protein
MTEELIASTAYLDLFLRSITEPGLMQTFLRFLITDHYDGERVIDKLVSRLGTKSQVSSRILKKNASKIFTNLQLDINKLTLLLFGSNFFTAF